MGKERHFIYMDPIAVEIIISLHIIFSDEAKINFWLFQKNLNFGDMTPAHLINFKKGQKVLDFINDALEANQYERVTNVR